MLTIDLHPYQEEAIERFLARGNLLLAFDMGTGKTLTSLGAAETLLADGEIDQALIIVPAGLKLQWASAIAMRTDVATQTITVSKETFQIPEERYCVVVDGDPKKRLEQYELIRELQPDYVVAGYETVAADLKHFRRMKPGLIIADEITKVKNPAARLTKAFRKLWAPRRLGLTGTPVDTRLEELYQIMHWIDGDLLGDFRHFDQAYIRRDFWGHVKGYRNMPVLARKVAPALIRKRTTDSDVAKHMPELLHGRWTVAMDPRTTEVYRHVMVDLERELGRLAHGSEFDLSSHYAGESEDTAAGRVMAVHLAAQMLLTEPELLFDSESSYATSLVDSGLLDHLQLSAKAAKLGMEVDRMLQDPEVKIIVVSQFRGMVSRLAELWGNRCVVYHGGMSPAHKQAAVNQFEGDRNIRLFVMSHAGAYGVDIPAASCMILLDPPRSAGQRSQIHHRHVRSGSHHQTVRVWELVTSGTIEERVYDRLDLQKRVANAALDGLGADASGRIENDVASLTSHIEQVLTK